MRNEDERGWLSEVFAPTPPVPLTVLEIQNLQKLAREQMRRAKRRLERDAGVEKHLPGADADAVKLQVFSAMNDKLESWLEASWPLVDEAKAAAQRKISVTGEGETVGEARFHAMKELASRANGTYDPARVTIVVDSEGVRGMLGVGQEPAVVTATLDG